MDARFRYFISKNLKGGKKRRSSKGKRRSSKGKRRGKRMEFSKGFSKKPKVGDFVIISIKPYRGKTVSGIVKKVLTKRKYHSRGHKVLLESGEIGRVIN